MKKIIEMIKKIRTYDRVYLDNKLTESFIITVCFMTIIFAILFCILWEVF